MSRSALFAALAALAFGSAVLGSADAEARGFGGGFRGGGGGFRQSGFQGGGFRPGFQGGGFRFAGGFRPSYYRPSWGYGGYYRPRYGYAAALAVPVVAAIPTCLQQYMPAYGYLEARRICYGL